MENITSIAVVVCILVPLTRELKHGNLLGFSAIFLLGAFFYYVPNIVNIHFFDNYLNITDQTLVYYNLSVIIFVFSFLAIIKYFSVDTYIVNSQIHFPDFVLDRTLMWLFLVAYVAYIFAFIGLDSYFSLNRASLYNLKAELPAFLEITLVYSKIFFFISYYRCLVQGRRIPVSLYIYVGLVILIIFPSGARGRILDLLLGVFFLVFLFGKYSKQKIVWYGIAVVIIAQLFSKIRHLTNDIGAIPTFFTRNFEWAWFDFSKGEAGANIMVFGKIYNDGDIVSYSTFPGQSYFDGFELLIPQFIYPARVDGLNTWFVKTFFYNTYVEGGGKSFSLLAEGMMNGGLLGVFILAVMLSLTFVGFIRLVKNVMGRGYVIPIYCSIMMILFQLPRLYFGSIIKQLVIMILVPVLVFYLVTKLIK